MQVDTEAETDGDWVPVIYNGTTGYVSSDYVTLSLATGEGVTIEEEREDRNVSLRRKLRRRLPR